MAAIVLKSPHWAISETEGKMLAQALIDVGNQYSVTIDPKTMAIINLSLTVAAVYAPRVLMTPKRVTQPQAQAQTQKPQPAAGTTKQVRLDDVVSNLDQVALEELAASNPVVLNAS